MPAKPLPLLSEADYVAEGKLATEKALEELRSEWLQNPRWAEELSKLKVSSLLDQHGNGIMYGRGPAHGLGEGLCVPLCADQCALVSQLHSVG